MTYFGRIENGAVIFDDDAPLPEGARVEVQVANPDEQRKDAHAQTIWQSLAALGKSAEGAPCDLPEDLAANHDHYLHGLPKRT